MKKIIKLNEMDIREAIAEKFGCESKDVVFDVAECPTLSSLMFCTDGMRVISASFVKKEEANGSKKM